MGNWYICVCCFIGIAFGFFGIACIWSELKILKYMEMKKMEKIDKVSMLLAFTVIPLLAFSFAVDLMTMNVKKFMSISILCMLYGVCEICFLRKRKRNIYYGVCFVAVGIVILLLKLVA